MMMENHDDVIEAELAQVRLKVPAIEGFILDAAVPILVRAIYRRTEHKQVTIHVQFPAGYPREPVIMEFKSKTLSDRLLDGLMKVCDEEAKRNVGQRQVILMLNFIKKFIDENPLCVCHPEISYIKQSLISGDDKVILKQKNSQIVIKVFQDSYFMNIRISVPEDYPIAQVQTEITDTNFPILLRTNFQAQAIEIARQCIQPPLKKTPKAPPFVPKPSLRPVCDYLISVCVKRYPQEICPICKEKVLSEDPKLVNSDPKRGIERVYCGHLFHNECLDAYMKTPPFTGGKKCPGCDQRIFHDKWKIPPELAETRWAHKQARQRELEEVVDFLS
ncbi:uncharacterized protein LOC121372466 [Gigantopelta aegis]|uniref:uncharacterized protein LOC121372466 n=1 Tax=Gigantopelta aegis TaxID=1735272 RepID=UPI001B88D971|nr:uncharacterized protein LOC121372466 [Gigantopelta aegis]